MDPVEALQRLGGVASLTELTGSTTRAQLRTAVAAGRIAHLRRDRYALVDADPDRATAAAAGGLLSHLSAATYWGWKVKHVPRRPWVTVPPRGRRPTGDLEVRWSDVPDADVTHHVTRPARTVIDCARALPFDEALAVADSALRSGEVERHELLLAAERSPRTGRARAVSVVEAADGRAANPFESVLRAIAMTVPGLEVTPQGGVPGVGWVDLLDPGLGLVVEAESFEFHGTLPGLRRDVKRYTACTRQGLTVVRFLWEEVMFDPEHVRRALVDVVQVCAARSNHSVGGSRGPVTVQAEPAQGATELPTSWSA